MFTEVQQFCFSLSLLRLRNPYQSTTNVASEKQDFFQFITKKNCSLYGCQRKIKLSYARCTDRYVSVPFGVKCQTVLIYSAAGTVSLTSTFVSALQMSAEFEFRQVSSYYSGSQWITQNKDEELGRSSVPECLFIYCLHSHMNGTQVCRSNCHNMPKSPVKQWPTAR